MAWEEEEWDDGSRRVQSGHRTKSRVLQSPMGPDDAEAASLVVCSPPFVLGFGRENYGRLPRTELDCYLISKLR